MNGYVLLAETNKHYPALMLYASYISGLFPFLDKISILTTTGVG